MFWRFQHVWLSPGGWRQISTRSPVDGNLKREFKGKRYDVGDKLGYMKTNIEYGLHHPEIGASLSAYIIQLSKELRTGN